MFPKTTKHKNLFKFDARLNRKELAALQPLIGSKVESFIFDNCQISLKPKVEISCYNPFCLRFKIDNIQYYDVLFTSLLKEWHQPIVPQGGILFQIFKNTFGVSSAIYPPNKIDSRFSNYVDYPNNSKIKKIDFYGSTFDDLLIKYDPCLEEEYLQEFGFSLDAKLEIQSIEFFIFYLEEEKKLVCSLDENGFWFNLNTSETIEELIQKSYLKINGANKNIILQHRIE